MDHIHTVHRSPQTERLDESFFTEDESKCVSNVESPVLAEERIWNRGQKRSKSVREDGEEHGRERKKLKPMGKKQAVVDDRHITLRRRHETVAKTGGVPGSCFVEAGKRAVGALSGFVHGTLKWLRTVATYVGPRLSTFTWSLNWNRPKVPPLSQPPISPSVQAESDGVLRTSDRSQQPQTASFSVPVLSSPDSLPAVVSTPRIPASRLMSPATPISSDAKFRLAVTCELQAEDSGQIVFQKTDNSVVYRTYDQMQKQLGQFRFSSAVDQSSFMVLSDDLPTLIKEMRDAAFTGGSSSPSRNIQTPKPPGSSVVVIDGGVKTLASLVLVDASTQADDGNSASAFPPTLPDGNQSVQEPLKGNGTAYEPIEKVFGGPTEELDQVDADMEPEISVESATKRKAQFDEEEAGQGECEGDPLMQDILSGIHGGDDSRTTFTFSDEDAESETSVQRENTADDANRFQSDEMMPQSSQSSMYPSDSSSSQGTITPAESPIAGSSGFLDDGATVSASQDSGRPRKRRRAGPATLSRTLYPRAAKDRGEVARLRLIPLRRARAPAQNRGRRQLSESPVSPPPASFRTMSDAMSASQPF